MFYRSFEKPDRLVSAAAVNHEGRRPFGLSQVDRNLMQSTSLFVEIAVLFWVEVCHQRADCADVFFIESHIAGSVWACTVNRVVYVSDPLVPVDPRSHLIPLLRIKSGAAYLVWVFGRQIRVDYHKVVPPLRV